MDQYKITLGTQGQPQPDPSGTGVVEPATPLGAFSVAVLFGWINCRERLPEMGEAVFMLEPTYGPMIGSRGWAEDGWLWGTSSGNVWHNGKRWDCDSEQDADYQPTHWHPLPSLPNQCFCNSALHIKIRKRLIFNHQ